ncbi:hypothetical protein B296_00035085 [Ensete ventricosum]|uniref:Uncharacterized protein n=1 Tax=Ensete ventricosum TaxID=4639 RepID=A0A426X210_ENSVE|nr:hypothetical protein B296_00035085 [Ensete ventricosum]
MVSHMSIVSQKNATVIDFAQSRVSIGFSCTISAIKHTCHSHLIGPWEVILARFRKKYDGYKLCAKSRAESIFVQFFVHRLGNSKYWPFTMYYHPMVSRTSMVSRKNETVINITESRVSIGFSCTVSEIQNTGTVSEIQSIGHSLAHGKSYEDGFKKKRDGHKLCVESSFDQFFVHRLENSQYWSFPVEFRLVFRAPSRKFKILVIPVLLAQGKSYKQGFVKKLDGHILCANREQSRVYDHPKYWPFPTY